MTTQTSLTTLNFVDVAGRALHAAAGLATKVAEDERRVAELAPQHADALHTARYIQAEEKQAAVEQLSTHTGALAVIGNLIKIGQETKRAFEQKLAVLGQGRAEPDGNGQKSGSFSKRASVGDDCASGGYVGRRAGLGEKRASDRAMLSGLGISSPS